MQLILAEKPSVAKNIADALNITNKHDGYFEGPQYIITWAFGHLLQLYDAKDYEPKMKRWRPQYFPFIPTEFKYKVKSNPKNRDYADTGAKKQLKIIQKLAQRQDVESIVSACDYDREGQVIGDSIIQHLHTKKRVYRLLMNEWTKQAVINGLEELRPNETMQSLQDAGISRQWADWVLGINLTSIATLKYQQGAGKALNIGRVLLPTLKIIYDRDKEIANFVPQDYFKLAATFQTNDGQQYVGTFTMKSTDKFKDKATLEKMAAAIHQQDAVVVDKQVEKKKEFAPFLFNLSNLQGYITNKFKGFTADKVLKIAQTLYEKKYITYPRTSSTALDESLVGKTAHVLKVVTEDVPYKDEVKFKQSKRVFNNQKVESHSAIIPTYVKPRRLTTEQNLVYTAIKNRFIMQFMPISINEETKIVTKVNEQRIQGMFISKGKVQLVEGWKKVENIQTKDNYLPLVQLNDRVTVATAEVSSHVTKPPKQHTEKTLLRVMETCGKNYHEDDVESILQGFSIGTPATRADTIKKLKLVGYITAKGKNLTCTGIGAKLVETFPVTELFDLEFTGRLEKMLADIEKKQTTKQAFLDLIFTFTKQSVAAIKDDQDIIIQQVESKQSSREIVGKCPVCAGNIVEGKKGFGCANWKQGCSFVIWKNDKYLATMKKKVTKTMVKTLLSKGIVHVKGFTSKKGKKFNAYLRYEKNTQNDYYSWQMTFK